MAGRIIQFLDKEVIKVTPFEENIGVSRGYLRQCAKNSRVIGSDIVGNFLHKFPKVDPFWLLLGKKQSDRHPIGDEIFDLIKSINVEDRKTIARLHSYIDRLEEENQRLKGQVAAV